MRSIILKKVQPKPARVGQGLLEGVVAVAVLVTGILSVTALGLSNLNASKTTESRLIAANLAREGIEVVRFLRDSNWLAGWRSASGEVEAWDTGITSAVKDLDAVPILADDFTWSLDFAANDISSSMAQVWRVDGLFRQYSVAPGSGVSTPFRRLLTLYPICRDSVSGDEKRNEALCEGSYVKVGIRVVSQVQWTESGGTKSLQQEDLLYNWRFAPAP